MSERLDNCLFCYRDKWILRRKATVFVQLDDAPIVEGHALICPDLHWPSAGDVPPDVAAELDEAVALMREVYLREYGTFAMFEHGRTGHCVRRNPGERICHHAHIHVLPLPGDLVKAVTLGQRTACSSWSDVAELAGDIEGYVVVETAERGRYFYPVSQPLESHYLRSRAAELAGDARLDDWEELIKEPESLVKVESAYERLWPLLGDRQSVGRALDA